MTITSFGPANRIARTAETHPLTWRLREDGEPVWLEEYQAKDGYAAARKALTQQTPDDIVQSVKDSGLKGRGGAGFPTGVKWGLMPKDESMNIRYLLCNADEMEPNTWKDRMLMEQLPHLLVEGMLISARALKAYRGYIFLRGEYVTAARPRLHGLLGKNILGTGFDFELFVHTGAGRYICGEETALINSLEGRRANPRSKPPFPAAVGVWGKPTCVNNVETLCNVPAIVNNGNDWYKSLAREGSEDHGTKLMGFSGKVKNPGPVGAAVRCSGSRAVRRLRRWHARRLQTQVLATRRRRHWLSVAGTPGRADVRRRHRQGRHPDGHRSGDGSRRLGQHGFTAAQHGRVLRSGVVRFLHSVPRRLPWSVKILRAIEKGQGQPGDIETLQGLVNFLGPGRPFCRACPRCSGATGQRNQVFPPGIRSRYSAFQR